MIIDEVKTIKNKGDGMWGEDPEVKLQHIMNLGETDGDKEDYLFYLPSGIAEDRDRNIYILDSGNFEVKKFSPDGKFISKFGRNGQGPGEFMVPIAIDINHREQIGVADEGNNRMEIFSPEGRCINSFTLKKFTRVKKFFFDKDRNFVFANGINPGYSLSYEEVFKEKSQSPLLNILNSEGQFLRGIGKVIFENNMFINMVKNRGFFCIDEKGNYYVTFKSLNRIQKYEPGGKIIFQSERQLNYEITVLSKVKSEKKRKSRITTYPKMNSVSSGIAVDGKKRIWVATFNRQIRKNEKVSVVITENDNSPNITEIFGNTDVIETDMFILEVFSSEGILLGKIQLRHFIDDIRIYHDRLYILDKIRGMRYYVYKITG